jgi:hypothetical protein
MIGPRRPFDNGASLLPGIGEQRLQNRFDVVNAAQARLHQAGRSAAPGGLDFPRMARRKSVAPEPVNSAVKGRISVM